jgi:biotin carboxylase
LTVNAFVRDGRFHALTTTDREHAPEPAFGVALAHVWPADPPDRGAHDVAAAIDVAERATRALGVEQGPTYTQVVLGADGPRLVELAARLGGGHDAELCEAALGIDLNGLAVAAALGEAPDVPAPRPGGGACVRFLVAPEGELVQAEGLDEARALSGVVEARVYREPGFRFGPLRTGSDRAGFVLAVGDSRSAAVATGAAAAAAIRLRVRTR